MFPSVSIVIPAFNAETAVHELVEDCMAQTFGNIEVICVDDGSDDGTHACIEDLSRRHTCVHALSIEHGGPTAARAAGAEAARGEWVIFADADDRVELTWIEALVRDGAKIDPQGEADIVAGASCWNRALMDPDQAGNRLEAIRSESMGLFKQGSQMNEVWRRMLELPGNEVSISHSMCDKLFRTTLARQVLQKIDRSIRIGEDTCFNLIAFAQARAVALVYTTGYRWTNTEGSLSHYPFAGAIQDNRIVYAQVKRELLGHGYEEYAAQLWKEWMTHVMSNQLLFLCKENREVTKQLAARFMASYEEAASE